MSRIVLQVVYLLSILYMASQLVFNMKNVYLHFTQSNPNQLLTTLPIRYQVVYLCQHILPLILIFAIWIIFMPIIMIKFTVITNIEMMKDSELIEKVISEQKLQRAKRSQRVF